MCAIHHQIRVLSQNSKSSIPPCFFHSVSDLFERNPIARILQSTDSRQRKHCIFQLVRTCQMNHIGFFPVGKYHMIKICRHKLCLCFLSHIQRTSLLFTDLFDDIHRFFFLSAGNNPAARFDNTGFLPGDRSQSIPQILHMIHTDRCDHRQFCIPDHIRRIGLSAHAALQQDKITLLFLII